MKKLKTVLLVIYLIFLIINTILLFTFNKFSNSEINNKIIAGINYTVDNYKKGDLLICSKNTDIKKGDKILFYDTKKGKNYINTAIVLDIKNTNDKTYVIRDNEFISSKYILGNNKTIKTLPLIGYLYLLFTSKIGYFIAFILPIIGYFILALRKYKTP